MIRENREYRNVPMPIIQKREEGQEPSFFVEGYASTFEEYVLFEYEGIEYKERIEPDAFKECDMSDVVFVKNHEGTVFARTRNNSLSVIVDDHGLYQRANLGLTSSARAMYEEIDAGLYDQMSFSFIVSEDEYDTKSHTRIIKKISKLFDVSAVNFPANDGTDISVVSARNRFNGFIELEQAERLAEQRELELAKAKFKFMEV